MRVQNLIIYKFTPLYHILKELGSDLNFNLTLVDNENSLKNKIKNLNYYLVLSRKKNSDVNNTNFPMNYTF